MYSGSEYGINNKRGFIYFTDSRSDASIYARGQFTKGGILYEHHNNIIIGINDILAEKGIRDYDGDDLQWAHNIWTEAYSYYAIFGVFPFNLTDEEINLADDILAYFDKPPKEDAFIKDLKEIRDLISDTTLRSEFDLYRQYDDPTYIENQYKLGKLFDKYKDLIDEIESKYTSGVIDEVFLNIRNPYIKEINSEDLIDNYAAYRNNHDGAYLLGGEHMIVKKSSQIKSATSNIGEFSRESDNINEDSGEVTEKPRQKRKLFTRFDFERDIAPWREIRGAEILAKLPAKIVSRVAESINEYTSSKKRGEHQ